MENDMDRKNYSRYVKAHAPKSPVLKDCFFAFLIGGGICTLGQAVRELWGALGASFEDAGTLSSMTLVFLTALLTGIGVFDDFARHAGAGTLVPITGFANAVASSAIDTKSEGFILGVGAKIFAIAGPVILYGISAGALYGIIYYVVGLF